MRGYRIYETRKELVDEFEETAVLKNYPVSDIYLTRKRAEIEMSKLKPHYEGNPINCWSEGVGFYIEEINIIDD